MFTIVLDTNVLISAIVFGGKPREVFELVITGEVSLAISDEILEELRGVLEGKKFCFSPDATDAIIKELMSLSQRIVPTQKINAIKNDPDDNRILECAIAAKADVIVSGDSDLLDLEKYEGILILSPEKFIKAY